MKHHVSPTLRFSVYLRPISLFNSRSRIPHDHHMYNCVFYSYVFCPHLRTDDLRMPRPDRIPRCYLSTVSLRRFYLHFHSICKTIACLARSLVVICQLGNSTALYHLSLLPTHLVYDSFHTNTEYLVDIFFYFYMALLPNK